MRLVGLLLLVFMVSALGGWFGVRFAANESSNSSLTAELSSEVRALQSRLEALESGQEPAKALVAALEDTSGEENFAEDQSSSDVVEDEMTESPLDSKWPPAKREWFEARASREIVTFTDLEGRVVEAKLVDVTDDSVKIVRSKDERQFVLPLDRLVSSDREFIEFLVETGKFSPTSEEKSDEVDWGAIFGEGSA